MKRQFFYLAWTLFVFIQPTRNAYAQETSVEKAKKPLIVSVFNTATQLPVGVFFSAPAHPGLSVGTAFRYNKSASNQFFQTAKAAVSYHQYVQTAIQLYTEAGYRRRIWSGLGAELRLGGGYLHSVPATGIYSLGESGYASKGAWGRPQWMITSAFGLGYALSERADAPRFFVDYQFYIQTPFVKSYVPLLPNTALHAGVSFPLFK